MYNGCGRSQNQRVFQQFDDQADQTICFGTVNSHGAFLIKKLINEKLIIINSGLSSYFMVEKLWMTIGAEIVRLHDNLSL